MRRWLLWVPLAVFAGLVALTVYGLRRPADRTVYSRMIGQPVPAFVAPAMLPGRPGLASATLHGRVRLVNVFASWCIPCAAEAPQLATLKARGVEVDGLAVRDTPTAVADFLARYGDPYARIGDDREARVQLALGSSGVPESFVVDGSGRIMDQHVGDIRPEDVSAIVAAVRAAR
ncbi:redoxin family protein [Sphingomonas bacterium]|uniref:redoxin family protein n=1 Tax=Sphingomonas bacterium TaxID=1895847 RepID=UPI001576619F|nr:redoxin family protein [Sphingomonas bacterium]